MKKTNVLFKPTTFFAELTNTMINHPDIDILLGIFPTKTWHKLGMTLLGDTDDSCAVLPVVDIINKPKEKPETDYAWGIAVWRVSFQTLLTACSLNHHQHKELVLGDVFMLAKSQSMKLCCLKGEEYIDTGTVEDLLKAIQLTNHIGIPTDDSC